MNIYPVFKISMSSLFIFFFGNLLIAAASDLSYPDAKTNSKSALMLDLTTSGKDPDAIVYENLIHLPAQPSVVSDVRLAGGLRVNQHAYLAYFGGRFWAMWSDGPGEPRVSPEKHWNVVPGHDRPFTRVSYATSKDGLNWSEVKDLSGPPRTNGFGWIARGLWERDGQLIALASHFNAPGYDGEGLSLEGWRWNNGFMRWEEIGTVLDDAMNNFPPKRLPNGKWMMTRRDHQRQVSVMLGGVSSHSDWTIKPLATYDGATQQPEEPYWSNGTVYILPISRFGKRELVEHRRDPVTNDRIGYFGDDPGDPIIAPAGSIAVFSSLVFHRSGANTTGKQRRVYLAQYAPERIQNEKGRWPQYFAEPFLKGGEPLAVPV